MRMIWKVNLNETDWKVSLPVGAVIVSAQYQRGDLCVWAIVDPDAEKEERKVHVIGTGNVVPDGVSYVGTVQDTSGYLVWHVFA